MLTGTRPSWRNFSFFICLLDRGRFKIKAAAFFLSFPAVNGMAAHGRTPPCCFTMELYFEAREYKVRLKGELGYPVTLGTDTFGNITRLDNALEGLPKRLEMNEMELDNLKKQFETAKVDVERPFPQEEELKAKTDRLNELNALLNVDKRENEIVGGEPDEGEEPPEKKPRDLER